jgi:ElaB/YqjD/DUF883 family membrane-anchored ribosome-binding protein
METIENVSQSAHEAVDKIASVTHQASAAFSEKEKQLKNAEQQLMENCRGYVRDNPITSLGIAAAAGFLLSRLLSGR